jgi:diguanylate cyclase (GGDEF)-like protein
MRGPNLGLQVACLAALAALGVVDFNTSPDARFGFIYLVPISVAGWRGGRLFGLLCAAVAAATIVVNDVTFRSAGTGVVLLWNEFTRSTTFAVAAIVSANLRRSRDRLRAEREDAFQMAIRDPLTGVYNLYFMREQLELLHRLAAGHRRGYAVIALDLDGLKEVNDRFGHQTGDEALRAFARILREAIRPGDIPVRTGGDEFLVILPDADPRDATPIAQRIVDAVRAEAVAPDHVAGASAGVATWRPGRSIDEVLAAADRLLYAGKHQGGRSVNAEPDDFLRIELEARATGA